MLLRARAFEPTSELGAVVASCDFSPLHGDSQLASQEPRRAETSGGAPETLCGLMPSSLSGPLTR